MASFAVILAAAGRSTRFGDPLQKKPFVELCGTAIWLRALKTFVAHPDVQQLLIVVAPDDVELFHEKFRQPLKDLNIQVVAGGAERADSVQNALCHLLQEIDYVAIHDAARPLLRREWVEAIFQAAVQTGAAIPAIPIRGTIKRVDQEMILETVPREGLWEAQTPQVFERQLLLDAYSARGGFVATDEAQLVERFGHPVAIVEGSPVNMKITTQDDLRIANALLDALPSEKFEQP